MSKSTITPTEKRAAFSLAFIFSFRMLGLCMILPVFAIFADDLPGATPTKVGMALGIYGLTQACLQIPFGMLSDRVGRKRMIAIGLCIFVIGSLVAALSHTLTGIIIGRALQGAGAVGSVIIALVADLTLEQHRTAAMAIIGMTIGFSFSVAMVLGPILNAWIGVSGIFWVTALLGVLGMVVLMTLVPTPKTFRHHHDAETIPNRLLSVLKNKELLRFDAGIMLLHATLTATFVALPVALEQMAGLPEAHQWYLYLPVLVVAFVAMIPFIIIAEKKRQMKPIFLGSIAALGVAELLLWAGHHSLDVITFSLIIFFTAFTLLEATLPSLVSKVAPAASKGTAMGVYSSCQFFGIFIGGTVGGWLFGQHHVLGVFLGCAILILIWLGIAARMKKPPHLATKLIPVGTLTETEAQQLSLRLEQITGISEVVIIVDEQTAYLKVDNNTLNEADLAGYIKH